MLDNNSFFRALACSAMFGVLGAEGHAGDQSKVSSLDASADTRYRQPRHEVVQQLRSKCRRYGVVWSGGVAARFSGRIRPRPVRSRWQRDGEGRIRCADVDAFRQQRVTDQPSIR